MNFNDYRNRISIAEIAEYLGYKKVSSANARHLEYILGNSKNPQDEIVIYPNGKNYFSRKGALNDKGDLINFVLHRLDQFSNCSQTGYNGVNEILSKYIGSELKVNRPIYNSPSRTGDITFDINKYSPRPLTETTFNYLNKRRYLSTNTINDFKERLFIYSVGNKENAGFPFRKPGQMEITNFELRNYDPVQNINFKGFCSGGDKTNSCWIANFVPFDKVTDVYLFESAIDGMSFYEIKHFSKDTTSAFVSIGGNMSQNQIIRLKSIFPKVQWHCCFDNDGAGKSFDLATAYYLKGENCKAYARLLPGDTQKTIFLCFPNGDIRSWKEEEFISSDFLKSQKLDNEIKIIKPTKYKDWNELLTYYKRFELNLGPGMKYLPYLEKAISQLNLRGYCQLSEMLDTNKQELINSLMQRSAYCLSAPVTETSIYKLMVDCNVVMGIDSMVIIPTNLQILDKSTQKIIPAFSMNEYLKKEGINLFKDFHASSFKDLMEKNILVCNKGNIERKFEKSISPSGWNLKECTPQKKNNFDIGLDI